MTASAGSPTLTAQPGVTAPASLPELARALKYDANLIYEYVYTNIEYSPTYGLKKGALGTLLDGVGNDMDQAALLVALLRASGYTANYQYGKIRLYPADIAAFYGVDATGPCPVGNLLSHGGIPVDIVVSGTPPFDCNSPLLYIDVTHTWVTATGGSLGATTYILDPSYKTYIPATGISLATAMSYDRNSLLSSAKSGASYTPGFSIQNVNATNIASSLTSYANNLVTYIRANNPTATPRDVLGGNYIKPLTQSYALPTSLAYQTPGTTPVTWTGDVPDERRTTLRVQIGGIDRMYFGDAIYGHRLSIVYDAGARPVLYLDGVVQGTGTANANTISYTVAFPFCFPKSGSSGTPCGQDHTNLFTSLNVVQAVPDYTYAIVAGWDFAGRGMVDFHRRQLQASKAAGNADGSEAVLGEALNMIGYAWLAQLGAAGATIDRIVGTKTITHCFVGVVAQIAGPYIDMPGGFVALSGLSNDQQTNTARENTSFFALGGALSALEWGALEQNLAKTGVGAVSTIKLIHLANAQGDVLYDTTSANWATVKPLTASYLMADTTEIDAYLNAGYRVVLPQHGNLNQGAWTGAGYVAISPVDQFGYQTIIYKISSNLKGGYSTGSVADSALVPRVVDTAPLYIPPSQRWSIDPIDLSSGAFQYDRDDLAVGSGNFPISLVFRRSYNSNNLYGKGPLGSGWTHSFAIAAAPNSDGLVGMGQASPIDGAAFIAATYVAQDLFSDAAKPFDKVVIASLVQKWMMDQLINNTVNVTTGAQGEQFVRLADGTYNPRLGSSSRLGLAGSTYTLQYKDSTTLNFNAVGDIASWNYPSGPSVSFAYDSSTPALLTSVSNNFGRTLTLAYNGAKQLTSVADDSGRNVAYAYDANGSLTSFTDTIGNPTTYRYAALSSGQPPALLTQIFYPSFPSTPAVTNVYDTLGRVARQTNANGATWNYFFAGYRSEEDDANGTQHVLYYNPRGKVQFEIQDYTGLGLLTKTLYDGLDRPILVTLPELGTAAYEYDVTVNPWANNVFRITRTAKPGSSLSALKTTYTYDPAFNKPTSVTDPRGLATSMAYDARGNLISLVADTATLKATTRYTYTALGLPLTVTDPVGTVTQYAYDSYGNLLSTILDAGAGRLNLTTAISYDAVGNPLTITDPRGKVTTNTYDANRRLLTAKSPPTSASPTGLVAANTWDADGRLLQTQQSSPGTVPRTVKATYTPTGQTASLTDANGNVSRYAYDLLDRRVSTTDAMGRITQQAYDALSRPTTTRNPALPGLIPGGALLAQTWTNDGLRASLTDANNNVTSFAYDGFDRLATTTYPGGSTEILGYDADSNVLTRTTRAGTILRYGYDTLNRLVTRTAAASPVACTATPSSTPTVTYAYDLAGRTTGVCDNSAAITAIATPSSTVVYSTAYAYDATNRPTGVSFGDVPAPTLPANASAVTFKHGYNAANQRISQEVDAAAPADWIAYPAAAASTTNYTANSLNQYTAVGAVTPTYDGNGNLTFDGTNTLGYDAENRLTSASAAGMTASYAFDGRGRRKSKTVNGTTTVFVTDADNREVLEYDGASGTVLRWYAYGLGPNDVLGQMNVAAGSRLSLVPDLQGSIVGVMDAGSAILTPYAYRPYGSSTASPSPFAYTGQHIDLESGLYYFRARHYSTAIGRFMQADPIGYDGGILLYAFVSNDPLNGSDPLGLCDNPQGCGGTTQQAFQGVPPPVATIGTAGAGVAIAPLVAGGAAFLVTLLYSGPAGAASTCTENPGACERNPQYVVRGGLAAPGSLQEGTALTSNGFGFSVQTAPGVPVDELARGGFFRNKMISVTTVARLEMIPGVIVNTGTPGRGDHHGTVIVPNPPPPGFFEFLSTQFARKQNPYPIR